MARLGTGAARVGDYSLALGLELEVPLALGLSLETGFHSVRLEDLGAHAHGDGTGADINVGEFDLGARFTYNYLRIDGLRIFPYYSAGFAVLSIDEVTYEDLTETTQTSADLGGYVRGGVNFLVGPNTMVGIDYKRVMDTSFVDYDNVAILFGMRF